MSKSNALETAWLNHLFANADIANVGDATGLRSSSTAGSLYFSLHTADPGEAGAQNTSETTYGSYARVAVARNGTEWTVSGNQVQNTNAVTFATGSSGAVAQNITHWGLGTASSGAGVLLYKGSFSTALYSGTGIQPVIAALGCTITED